MNRNMKKSLYESIMTKVSKDIKKIINEAVASNTMPEILYRCGELENTNPVDVITYEIFELRNIDIFDYVLNTYGDKLSSGLKEEMLNIINGLDEYNDDDEYDDDASEDIIRDVASMMLRELERNVWHVKIKSVVWLATEETVQDIYMYDADEDDIDAYQTTPYVLSDLGYDGILFGYTTRRPRKIETD